MSKKDILVWMRGYKNFYKQWLKPVLIFSLDVLYPNTCIMCGKICGQSICATCRNINPIIKEPRCMCCGKPIYGFEEEYCSDCKINKKLFLQGRSIWVHKDNVKQSIYRFKYKNHRIYAKEYARILVEEHGENIIRWKPDCIIPVPVHWQRRRSRGYNQAEILAEAISNEMEMCLKIEIPVVSNIVYRKRETIYQKKLDNHKRLKNIENAFGIKKPIGNIKNVLVVDDIYTSGATMKAMSEVLIKSGVVRVCFFTISIGQGF